jgi:hypothetical protein
MSLAFPPRDENNAWFAQIGPREDRLAMTGRSRPEATGLPVV